MFAGSIHKYTQRCSWNCFIKWKLNRLWQYYCDEAAHEAAHQRCFSHRFRTNQETLECRSPSTLDAHPPRVTVEASVSAFDIFGESPSISTASSRELEKFTFYEFVIGFSALSTAIESHSVYWTHRVSFVMEFIELPQRIFAKNEPLEMTESRKIPLASRKKKKQYSFKFA